MMDWLQIVLYLVVLLLLVKPLGAYMAQVYQGERTWLHPLVAPLERASYRLAAIDPAQEMSWKRYALALLGFNAAGFLLLYLLLRVQQWLPLNPAVLPAVAPSLAFNTAVSFVSNTNWQFYGGETTLSYLTQMAGLTVQNFLSAATGMAVLVALARGLARQNSHTLGNFWVDMTRSTLYILLPISIVLALLFVGQGIPQTFAPYQSATLTRPLLDAEGQPVATQLIAVGPVASQVAIKQLGTNGGGFFNVNSAHPLENPTPLSNFLQMLAILLIPAAICYTFGQIVNDSRQGWALLAAMTVVLVAVLLVVVWAEGRATPQWATLGIDQVPSALQAGGNMEGKEVRFGASQSALWAVATTAASNGSVNAMHDSFTPTGGLVALLLMLIGEVIFGGVGSGLYGMLAFVIVGVFVAGLMVGRTPEYLNKKIESYEMQMAAVAILTPVLVTLLFTALAVVSEFGRQAIQDGGPHGFSELFYAFASQGNNNGSAFAGLTGNPALSVTGALAMLVSRYWVALPMLAIAGALAAKQSIPPSAGTLPTHTPLFIGWLIGIILVVGALSYFPALALGPIVEELLFQQAMRF
jgi:potassium-transporting ATPase potassium-binding subunit